MCEFEHGGFSQSQLHIIMLILFQIYQQILKEQTVLLEFIHYLAIYIAECFIRILFY